MSQIDLTNPKVRASFITSQIKEKNGKIYKRKDVYVFQDKAGNEYVVPEDMNLSDKEKKDIETLEKSENQELREENDKLKKEVARLKGKKSKS